MNNVISTKEYKGHYSIAVITAAGNSFEFSLRKEVFTMDGVRNREPWNLCDTQDKLDLCCAAWHSTKSDALRFLKTYTLEDNLYPEDSLTDTEWFA
tara:strand:- start:15408 stop:15695 length:288 start_codon:yes stop_codon:yes gene_type:complete